MLGREQVEVAECSANAAADVGCESVGSGCIAVGTGAAGLAVEPEVEVEIASCNRRFLVGSVRKGAAAAPPEEGIVGRSAGSKYGYSGCIEHWLTGSLAVLLGRMVVFGTEYAH